MGADNDTPDERDTRPRPKYGELAPEGWTWKPPKDAAPPQVPTPSTPPPAPRQSPAGTAKRQPGSVPSWDRPLTLGLLVFGLFGAFFAVSLLGAVPDAVQVLYTQQDLGDYTPHPSVSGLITAGGITQTVIWLVTAAVSILLLVRGKRAFYVPLLGGVISFVVIFVFLTIVLATDPTLIDFYSQP
ncbi:DUF6264 family protein [Glaciibacter superstes]|uniref:DUF6264 family protein n=1 Tax=Glaciibacter superstes TaxID=501023 RepID=UPI0003B5031F|nr:DUF6264 family protein [Glaciibacter superstes]